MPNKIPKWLMLLQVIVRMALTIYVGIWIDVKYPDFAPWGVLLFSGLAVLLGVLKMPKINKQS